MLRWPKALLKDPRVDHSDNDNEAIKSASKNRHTEIVRLLLKDPRVDPSADDNNAIQFASEDGHTEILRLLLEHPRVKETLGEEVWNNYLDELDRYMQ